MSVKLANIAFPIVSATVLSLTLPACESNGSYRVASVGAAGPQGIQGPQGAQGPAGTGGQQGPGGLAGLNGTGALAAGGLVGPGGVAGTGLLANTGDPANRKPAVSGVLVATGNAASGLAARGTPLAERVDRSVPGDLAVTGRVIRTLDRTGQALVRGGDGRDYLVDGLAAAPGQLVTLDLRDTRSLGRNGDRPLVGASLLSPGTQQGGVLTTGVGSGGRPLTVGTPVSGGQQNGPATGVGSIVNTVTGGVTGGQQQGTTGAVGNLLGGLKPRPRGQ